MGGSAALCHIRHDPVAPGEHGGCFTLKAANVGRCQAVLCRNGKTMQLSATHTVKEELEYQRVRQHNGVITEVKTHSAHGVSWVWMLISDAKSFIKKKLLSLVLS